MVNFSRQLSFDFRIKGFVQPFRIAINIITNFSRYVLIHLVHCSYHIFLFISRKNNSKIGQMIGTSQIASECIIKLMINFIETTLF